jgi:hypothetical protein
MRLCVITRGLAIISIALMVGYAYLLEVRGPYWPVYPIEWRAVGELGLLTTALISLIAGVVAAHCPEWHSRGS